MGKEGSLPPLDRQQHFRIMGAPSPKRRTAQSELSTSHWNAAVAACFAAIRCECKIVAKVNIHSADLATLAGGMTNNRFQILRPVVKRSKRGKHA
jgi:hypothetical protein